MGCAACHPAPTYTDNRMHDVGTATPDERIGPTFNTPSLLGVYDTPPYFHDGSASDLWTALTHCSAGSEHDLQAILTDAKIADLIAFISSLPFE